MEPLLLLAANRTNSTLFFNLLGALYLIDLQYDEAKLFLSLVEQRNPRDPDMLYNFARLYLELGNQTLAMEYFNKYQTIR
jgi:tetratricopeptide (TPR) repeat protein